MEYRILIWFSVIIFLSCIEESLTNPYSNGIIDYFNSSDDPGEPLFLTPLIESGNISYAKELASVPFTNNMDIKSYSGFFTVNKTSNSNQFFWYFPPISTPQEKAPIILWLQGGPGQSSMYGLFKENGPLMVEEHTFLVRKYHWALNHHVIYVDNPVGTGFSFTDQNGYAKDQFQIGQELLESMKQFFQLFPQLKNNKFYISGESYAGKYVPALGYAIHMNNNSTNDKINLKGLAIGNGFCDPVHQLGYSKYIYQLGLIDSNQSEQFTNWELNCIQHIKHEEWRKAFECFNSLLFGDTTPSLFYNFTGLNNHYNYLNLGRDFNSNEYEDIIQLPRVRKSIHVGNRPFNHKTEVERNLEEDITKSVATWIIELLNHYDIMFYNGQLDIIVAYPLTEHFLQNLAYKDAEKYKTAIRHIWRVDDEIAGYVKTAGKLTEVLVRKAGHMVPADQPKWALDLITRFTHEQLYCKI